MTIFCPDSTHTPPSALLSALAHSATPDALTHTHPSCSFACTICSHTQVQPSHESSHGRLSQVKASRVEASRVEASGVMPNWDCSSTGAGKSMMQWHPSSMQWSVCVLSIVFVQLSQTGTSAMAGLPDLLRCSGVVFHAAGTGAGGCSHCRQARNPPTCTRQHICLAVPLQVATTASSIRWR